MNGQSTLTNRCFILSILLFGSVFSDVCLSWHVQTSCKYFKIGMKLQTIPLIASCNMTWLKLMFLMVWAGVSHTIIISRHYCNAVVGAERPIEYTVTHRYYVMRSSGISRNSHMWHFQFSICLKCSLGEVHFAKNPTWIGPVVLRSWAIEGF